MSQPGDGRVAVYIDFDNIVISRYDQVNGRSQFQRDRAKAGADGMATDPKIAAAPEKATVDLGAVIDFASSFGTLVLDRAYADWSAAVNADYRGQLVGRAVDLVQLFPAAAYAKNGADIRLAVDAVEDLFRLPDLTHVVIVAGDSDYIALAQRCKRLGRYVVGIGMAGSTSKALAAACDEFVIYDDLPGVAPVDADADQTTERRRGVAVGVGAGARPRRPPRAHPRGASPADADAADSSETAAPPRLPARSRPALRRPRPSRTAGRGAGISSRTGRHRDAAARARDAARPREGRRGVAAQLVGEVADQAHGSVVQREVARLPVVQRLPQVARRPRGSRRQHDRAAPPFEAAGSPACSKAHPSTGVVIMSTKARGWVATQWGGFDDWEFSEHEVPAPGQGEVSIRVRASGVNPADYKHVSMPNPGLELPVPIGYEVAGIISEIGPDTEIATGGGQVGDAVVAFRIAGGYATELTVPARDVLAKPPALGFPEAANLLLAGSTASQMLHVAGAAQGDTVLLHGASGAVGVSVLQQARALGVRVIGTASEARFDEVQRFGGVPIAYGPGLVDRAREAAPEGFTAALDAIGTDEAVDASLELVGDRSRIVTIAAAGRAESDGFIAINGRQPESIEYRDSVRAELLRRAGEGELVVPIARTYPLAEARDALRFLQEGHPGGKLALLSPRH